MNCLQAKIQIGDGGDNIKSLNLGLIMGTRVATSTHVINYNELFTGKDPDSRWR